MKPDLDPSYRALVDRLNEAYQTLEAAEAAFTEGCATVHGLSAATKRYQPHTDTPHLSELRKAFNDTGTAYSDAYEAVCENPAYRAAEVAWEQEHVATR